MSQYSHFMKTALEAASLASDIISGGLGSLEEGDVSLKNPADFVTRIDRASEDAIVGHIKAAFPQHGFMAEESGTSSNDSPYVWIIDPLDGTTNFIHGFPFFAVSIGLMHEGRMAVGVVKDPVRAEVFSAVRGGGAFVNGKPMRVRSVGDISTALVATGFPFKQKNMLKDYFGLFERIFKEVSGIRRAGAAALDLASLAAGRCDGFFEFGLSPWDMAAGSLLIEEAGGVMTDFAGGGDFLETGNILAGTPEVHPMILAHTKEAFKGIIDR